MKRSSIVNGATFYCLSAGDVTDDVQLLPVNYQRIFINKRIFFIDRLSAVSAAHFDANTTILRQTVQN